MSYGDFKNLTRRTAFDKILRDKAFNLAKNSKYDGYQGALLQWFINFLIKNPLCLHGQRRYLREINLLPVVLLKMKI